MKIYTKTGDQGTTSLVGGTRVSKADLRLDTYGTADELNSFVGWLRAYDLPSEYDAILAAVQNKLFNLGSFLATEDDKMHFIKDLLLKQDDVRLLENSIDQMTETLPKTTQFILPAGNKRVALCHVCRTITRRLERLMVALLTNDNEQTAICLQYVNRLSDFFFILSKKIAQIDGCDTFFWGKE